MVPALERLGDDIVVGDDRFELDLWERVGCCNWEVRPLSRGDVGKGRAPTRHEAIAAAARWCESFVDSRV